MKEDIIRMAREAGWHDELLSVSFTMPLLERLVTIAEDAMVKRMHAEGFVTVGHMRQQIAAEREACAEVCDSEATIEGIAQRCAAAIRTRGQV
jgi:hypothetical protein